MTLVEFLRARLDEDEATAKAAPYELNNGDWPFWVDVDQRGDYEATNVYRDQFKPERALTEVDARRPPRLPAGVAAVSIQRCSHAEAVPVESGGETVAALCPDCDQQLPADWLTCRHDPIDVSMLGAPLGRMLCQYCGTVYWDGDGAD